jgi:hypothetical protein
MLAQHIVSLSEFGCSTAINLAELKAIPGNREVTVSWTTASEIDNAGFNIYRSETKNGTYTKISDSLIPAQGSATQAASYEFTDTDVQNRNTYYYQLQDIDFTGKSTMHGPVSAMPQLIKSSKK